MNSFSKNLLEVLGRYTIFVICMLVLIYELQTNMIENILLLSVIMVWVVLPLLEKEAQ